MGSFVFFFLWKGPGTFGIWSLDGSGLGLLPACWVSWLLVSFPRGFAGLATVIT